MFICDTAAYRYADTLDFYGIVWLYTFDYVMEQVLLAYPTVLTIIC
jgi:hypothetical protein